eukprot:2977268-Ditylum_brightwellii.AAC.1
MDDGQVYDLGLQRRRHTGMWHLAAVLWIESRDRGGGSHDEPTLVRARGRGELGHSPRQSPKCLQPDQLQDNAVG